MAWTPKTMRSAVSGIASSLATFWKQACGGFDLEVKKHLPDNDHRCVHERLADAPAASGKQVDRAEPHHVAVVERRADEEGVVFVGGKATLRDSRTRRCGRD